MGTLLPRSDTPEETRETSRAGLGRVVDVAARQADARGHDSEAVTLLDNGIERYPDADRTEVSRRSATEPPHWPTDPEAPSGS